MDNRVKIDEDNPSIQRIEEKCINCGVCLNTCTKETGLDKDCRLNEGSTCINCGQCVLVCPMGALKEKYDYKKVLNLVKDTEKLVAISVAPAVRVALGEEFGLEFGTSMEGILPAILKEIGFSYVFDVTFGADVTIMEEATELLFRINNGGYLPMFTSCCPAWLKYAKMKHPELVSNISTTKSPIGIQSSLIKSYFREMNGIEQEIISVVVAPCTAKKWEIANTETDYVITTRELALMIKEAQVDIKALKPASMDMILGEGSKAGLLFGRSGGVMESALKTAYHMVTGRDAGDGQFKVLGDGPIREASYKLGDKVINVAVVYGMSNLEKLLSDKEKYDFIEVMSCPLGCVGGGGQPLGTNADAPLRRDKRKSGLDETSRKVSYPYQNESIHELYKSYLMKPMSELARKLLHNERERQ